ncbi:MAG: rhodanese-like domain-containing protein [Pseudomonadota bacterium]
MNLPEIEPAELAPELGKHDWCLLDVREDWERDIVQIEGSLNIPLGTLQSRIDEIPADRPVAVLCHGGIRSAQAANFLIHSGRSGIYNVTGGIDRWSTDVDPGLPRY